MQRLGFPRGSNTGKGKPSSYSWRELFLLKIAFQYLEIGVTPDRVVGELTKHEGLLLSAIKSVVAQVYISPENDELQNFLFVRLSALQSLKSDKAPEPSLSVLSQSQLNQMFSNKNGITNQSRYTFFDLAHITTSLLDEVSKVLPHSDQEIIGSLVAWAGTVPIDERKSA